MRRLRGIVGRAFQPDVWGQREIISTRRRSDINKRNLQTDERRTTRDDPIACLEPGELLPQALVPRIRRIGDADQRVRRGWPLAYVA